MFSRLWHKLIIIISLFLVFTFLYKLLEKPNIYHSTLGKITNNYLRVKTDKGFEIVESDTAFTRFQGNHAANWDAVYYRGIRDSMYSGTTKITQYRYAFYPFFPMIWKLSHANSHGIILLNYLFFGLFLLLLSSVFMKGTTSEIFFFVIALLLPTSISYRIPYTESLFALTFSLAIIGLLKQKYWLYFIAMLFFTMTRPAALMFCAAFSIINLLQFIQHKKILLFIKECLLTALPVIVGVFIVTLIQFYYSHSWTSYIEACGLWTKRPDLYKAVSDWSVEGFSMNTFAIFFFAVPVIVYAIIKCIKTLSSKTTPNSVSLFGGNEVYIKEYMFNISILFITIFSFFTLWASGYDINGFSRYTMATPFFYIILFQLPQKLETMPWAYKASAFIIGIAGILLFLMSTEYAGDILRFQYLGLYLLIPLGFMIIFQQYFSNRVKIILLILLLIPCSIWHAYLFNMYLGDTWIFT